MTPPTGSRKQREVAQREALLLDTAQALLIELGYIGLTMDRLADATEFSKGTVYQHFANKEDLVAAIAERSAEMRSELFERALAFQGPSRERIGAIGAAAEVFLLLYPHHEQAERIVKTSSIRDKVSAERGSALGACEVRCFAAALSVVHGALADGDLTLAEDQSPEQVCMGLWNLYMGAFLMREVDLFLDNPTFSDPMPILLKNAQVLLDGFGWRPLSRSFDYMAARERALRELFPDEARAVGLL
ncbi:MAG: helix-turn-helix domain-containing protein [Planctomycetota bacterium]